MAWPKGKSRKHPDASAVAPPANPAAVPVPDGGSPPEAPGRSALSRRYAGPAATGNPLEGLDELVSGLDEEMKTDEGAPPVEPAVAAPGQPAEHGDDISKLLAKYQGKPDELAKALLHQQRMTAQKDKQLQLLVKGQPAGATPPAQPAVPGAPAAPPAPIMPQIQVQPFDKKTFGEKFLDDPGSSAEQLLAHASQYTQTLLGPVYGELIEARMFREYPDVVTRESWPIIKAMASSQEGQTIMHKLDHAVQAYREAWTPPDAPAAPANDAASVEAMKRAAAQPSPQGRSAGNGKKTYYRDEIQRLIQRDPERYNQLRPAIQRAYEQGRVMDSRANPVPATRGT